MSPGGEGESGEPGRQMAQVCGEVARVFSARFGRGPTKCRATWAGRDVVLVVLDDGYSPAEETLRKAGRGTAVLAGRRLLLEVVEPEIRSLVTRATGRSVTTVLSATRLDPDMTAQVIVLAPPADARSSA
jgi:uncharacterized protein YbcI